MDIRDNQAILNAAFDSNGTYAENDTILLRQICLDDKESYLDIFKTKPEWKMLFDIDPQSASENLWNSFLEPDTLNTVIIRKKDNMFCGYCSIQQYAKSIEPELSIELVKSCQHQGIGTIALPLLMKRFSEITGIHTFITRVQSSNIASLGLMHKIGGILQESENKSELAAKAEQISNALTADLFDNFGDILSELQESIQVFRHTI